MLVHRIPYPPNKGDKVRSFHLLKYLSTKFNVYLGAFIDDEADIKYTNELRSYCKQIKLIKINPLTSKLTSLFGLLSGEALSIVFYRKRMMRNWVDEIVMTCNIRKAIMFSSPMMQYLERHNMDRMVADFVDIDSDKWDQYSKNFRFPLNWIYRREAKKLLTYERRAAGYVDKVFFVSSQEKRDFDEYSPDTTAHHDYYNNGVDFDYFNPALNYENPYFEKRQIITFTGAMDYWANVNAVIWFVEYVFPEILKIYPLAQFYIVGSNPDKNVKALANSGSDAVVVTGRVEDIRPYIAHADLIVAPLHIARGVQNKVLEAMAMKKNIVATKLAFEGIDKCEGYTPLCADTPEEFAQHCINVLRSNEFTKAALARECVIKNYNWERNIDKVVKYIN